MADSSVYELKITVGYVAGFIAATVFIARIWLPTALTLILAGVLGEKNTAATWAVTGHALQKSYWPNILRADSTKNQGVPIRIIAITAAITLMSLFITVAGIVTPLGLYEALVQTEARDIPFKYIADSSPFGYGTPPRSNFTFNRICGLAPCPFSDTIVIAEVDSQGSGQYTFPYGYNVSIPDRISEAYSSGTSENTTISNYFDIQWRRYVTTKNENYNNGSAYLIGSFRQMESMVLNNALEPVEGLVVDTVSGGIGLRNHTIPQDSHLGTSWSEDLLFVEPETVCVDTNTTIDFTITAARNWSTVITELEITDRGGFSKLNTTYPYLNLSDTQANPDLRMRAYKAAFLTNVYTMFYYNITNPRNSSNGPHAFSYMNSDIGKAFPLPLYSGTDSYDSLAMDNSFGYHLNIFGGKGYANSSAPGGSSKLSNPWRISSSNFSDISLLCSGAGGLDYANITNILVSCGLMRGIPQRQDGGSSLIFESGSRWSQPIYSCATAARAILKTVAFSSNGTTSLKDLTVKSITPKIYSKAEDIPIWGVENTGNAYTESSLSGLIWGLISPSWAADRNVSAVKRPHLYLPGYGSLSGPAAITSQNLPGSEFYSSAMGGAYSVGDSSGVAVDYSGGSNMAMWVRWQNLSRTTETAGLIPNLIWTDYAAAAVAGTKGVLGYGNAAQQNKVRIEVTPTVKKIRYHWTFAIPAFIVLIGLLVTTTIAMGMTLFGYCKAGKMRKLLRVSSMGRVVTAFYLPDEQIMGIKEKEWSERFGKFEIDISGGCLSSGREKEQSESAKGDSNVELLPYERTGTKERFAEDTAYLGSR